MPVNLLIGLAAFIVVIGGSVVLIGVAGRRILASHAARLKAHVEQHAAAIVAQFDDARGNVHVTAARIEGVMQGRAVTVDFLYGTVRVHCDVAGSFDAQQAATDPGWTIEHTDGRSFGFEASSARLLDRLRAMDRGALEILVFTHRTELLSLDDRRLGMLRTAWTPGAAEVIDVVHALVTCAGALEAVALPAVPTTMTRT